MRGWDADAFDRWLTTDPENQPEIPEDDSTESYLAWLRYLTGTTEDQ